MRSTGNLRVEFGNHGWRYWVNENQAPSRRGYVAIWHGLTLPGFFLGSSSIGGATVRNISSMAVELAGVFALDGEGGYVRSGVDNFKAQAVKVAGLGGQNFTAWTEKKYVAAVRGSCEGDALPLLLELTKSFDLEVRDGWLFVHSYYGEVVTKDPEIWAWVFSVASRLCELIEIWGAQAEDYRSSAFYTRKWIDRPKKLDGVLNALLPKRSGKLGTFLFGRGPA